MIGTDRSSERKHAHVQELQRLHKSTVAEAAVLCESTSTTVVYPRNVSLSGVTNSRNHDIASFPITRVSQDAFYAARGILYIPNTGNVDVEWFLKAEEMELLAAGLEQTAVCNSLKPRPISVTVLAGADCNYNVNLLDAIAHIASSRCASMANLMCESTPTYADGFRASTVLEAARSTRIGFLVGSDAEAYIKSRSAAFKATGSTVPTINTYGAMIVVAHGIKTSDYDVNIQASWKELDEGYGRSSNIDAFASELQRVIAQIFSDRGLRPRSELFQPLPQSTETPFIDHVAAIHNEFFSLLRAAPEVRRLEEEDTRPRALKSSEVYVRFVPKNLRCEDPVTAHACFHGMLLCYPDKIEELHEYLREARQRDRNPLYGIAAPNDSRQEAIGIHVMVIQTQSIALEDNVTSFGLLGSPGKRLSRDGNYVMRTYRQLFALTSQLVEQHFLLPCTFQSCIPLKEEVGRAYFGAFDACYATFAEHLGNHAQVPNAQPTRPSTWAFTQQEPEDARLTRAIGLGFGSPAMRIGQLVAHLQSSPDNNDGCPDALVSLLMSALSTIGPHASVVEAFNMARDVIEKRDKKLKEADERVSLMKIEMERLKTCSPVLRADTTGHTNTQNTLTVDSCDIPPLSLPINARNKIMVALGLQKGAGGVSIATPVEVNGKTEAVAAKLTKLVVAALRLKGAGHTILEACKTACISIGKDASTQRRIETVARKLVALTPSTDFYVAVVGTPTDRFACSNAQTSFHHIRPDGGVCKVPLCRVLESTQIGMIVVTHTNAGDECYWYKLAE